MATDTPPLAEPGAAANAFVEAALPDTTLKHTAQALVADDKGLLAIDESIRTCNRRFAKLGIPQTVQARRAYRELIITTPNLRDSISGVIVCDETIRQHTADGVPFLSVLSRAGIATGIKVDLGTTPMAGHPGETITEGLDGLRARLAEYRGLGAGFAKWRAVFTIGAATPSRACTVANAHALARYAALCQEAGLVPVVEPEVLMAGEHTLSRCAQVTGDVLRVVFSQLEEQGVVLEGMLLKPNMILPGLDCPIQDPAQVVAEATRTCLRRAVPAAVAGITFLRWPVRRSCHDTAGRHQHRRRPTASVARGIFLRPRDPATGLDNLGRPGRECSPRTAGPPTTRCRQSGCPPRDGYPSARRLDA